MAAAAEILIRRLRASVGGSGARWILSTPPLGPYRWRRRPRHSRRTAESPPPHRCGGRCTIRPPRRTQGLCSPRPCLRSELLNRLPHAICRQVGMSPSTQLRPGSIFHSIAYHRLVPVFIPTRTCAGFSPIYSPKFKDSRITRLVVVLSRTLIVHFSLPPFPA